MDTRQLAAFCAVVERRSFSLAADGRRGPAAIAIPVALCEFQHENPDVRVFLTVSDTHSVVERVAARELELGIVGASRRHPGVRFEPLFSVQALLPCPP